MRNCGEIEEKEKFCVNHFDLRERFQLSSEIRGEIPNSGSEVIIICRQPDGSNDSRNCFVTVGINKPKISSDVSSYAKVKIEHLLVSRLHRSRGRVTSVGRCIIFGTPGRRETEQSRSIQKHPRSSWLPVPPVVKSPIQVHRFCVRTYRR